MNNKFIMYCSCVNTIVTSFLCNKHLHNQGRGGGGGGASVDDAIAICHRLGKGALMAKVDLKDAFRLCPVCPEDWHLLGIYWKREYYIDKCLPFGLRWDNVKIVN